MKPNAVFIVTVVLFLAALALSVPLFTSVPSSEEEPQVARMPMQIGEWSGRDLPVEELSYQILETRNLILREYARGGEKVYLYIIYSTDNRKVSHPPEVCFEGGGISIIDKEKISLELADGRLVPANRLKVEKEGLENIVYYLYKAGGHYTDNYMRQQLYVAQGRLRFQNLSNAMIRISAEVKPEDGKHADQLLRDFFKALSSHFSEIIP
ncbi:MAG: exosortase C-terminal domain/associated protein EpsI [Deltaproteobacteria bacterium]